MEHKDTLGNGSVVAAGGVQYMSAGSGVSHSEFNPSQTDPMRFLQIWLIPAQENTAPRYETMDIEAADKMGNLKLFLFTRRPKRFYETEADASVYAATLDGDQEANITLTSSRKGWVQVADGSLKSEWSIIIKGRRPGYQRRRFANFFWWR